MKRDKGGERMSGKGVGRSRGLDVISLEVLMNLSDAWEEQRDALKQAVQHATCPLRAKMKP